MTWLAAQTTRAASSIAESGVVPDVVSRYGIRRLLGRRLLQEGIRLPAEHQLAQQAQLLGQLQGGAIAEATDAANEQHYELPAEFFEQVLGPRKKYSCCWFGPDDAEPWAPFTGRRPTPDADALADAEDAMLARTCETAQLLDGMRVLDLGCGWGSMTLWIAQHYPNCQITSVSNSASQRAFIEGQAAARGHDNVSVITADVNELELDQSFDRIISIEMFEHTRNWGELFGRLRRWISDEGRVLIHVFCHRQLAYLFDARHSHDWMSSHFFTGGLMPSDDLVARATDAFSVEEQVRYNGHHYEATANAWLANLDRRRDYVLDIFDDVYGADAPMWLHRWRLFFMACAELFAYDNGTEWYVSHYRLAPR
ncbi:MAG: cyclopropane-fatty-acyl-phospholipid synthase family protein [Actinomycetota bacterium]